MRRTSAPIQAVPVANPVANPMANLAAVSTPNTDSVSIGGVNMSMKTLKILGVVLALILLAVIVSELAGDTPVSTTTTATPTCTKIEKWKKGLSDTSYPTTDGNITVTCNTGYIRNPVTSGYSYFCDGTIVSVKTSKDSTKKTIDTADADPCISKPATPQLISKCAAGKKFVAISGSDAAKCDDCGKGTFNAKDDNSTTCAPHNTCKDLSTTTKGTPKADAVCGLVVACEAGKKFVAISGKTAAKCEVCGSGTFNAKNDKSTTCTTHTKCKTPVKTNGTTTKDTECLNCKMITTDKTKQRLIIDEFAGYGLNVSFHSNEVTLVGWIQTPDWTKTNLGNTFVAAQWGTIKTKAINPVTTVSCKEGTGQLEYYIDYDITGKPPLLVRNMGNLLATEGFENYVPQPVKDIFDWIAGRPDMNEKSKLSLLPGY